MIITMSIFVITLLTVFSYFQYKDIRYPGFIFLLVWLIVCVLNAGFINYIEVSDETYIYITTMFISFFIGTLFFKKEKSQPVPGYINQNTFKLIFYISLFVQLMAVLILLFEAQRFPGGVIKYIGYLRSVQMYPDEATFPGLLGNELIMRVIKNNYMVNYFLFVMLALKSKNAKKWILFCLMLRLMYAGMMGSRWQGVMDILSLSFIYLDRHRHLLKPLVKYFVLFLVFFMLAGTVRSANGFGIEYLFMYIFGGLPAFNELLKNPDLYYLPNTAVYAEQLLGIAPDKVVNIVADSIWLNNDIKTNTYTVFGVMFKYYNEIGSLIYFFSYGAILNLLYCRKSLGITYAVLYYMVAPTVLLTVFTESMLGLLPTLIRFLIIMLLLKMVIRVKNET